ncbi:hypothetical protein BSPWISOX_1723 [uncultured Gammaproteobacteria bacterium]|nr:hypothetical protein BSPWISOX_1723 [uncultured Gammaproteobacteria bacterium]
MAAYTLLTPPNTKAFRWLNIKNRVSDFLRVSINIVLGWFFKNTLYFNPKKSHWGGKIMLLKLLGMLNCLL